MLWEILQETTAFHRIVLSRKLISQAFKELEITNQIANCLAIPRRFLITRKYGESLKFVLKGTALLLNFYLSNMS